MYPYPNTGIQEYTILRARRQEKSAGVPTNNKFVCPPPKKKGRGPIRLPMHLCISSLFSINPNNQSPSPNDKRPPPFKQLAISVEQVQQLFCEFLKVLVGSRHRFE